MLILYKRPSSANDKQNEVIGMFAESHQSECLHFIKDDRKKLMASPIKTSMKETSMASLLDRQYTGESKAMSISVVSCEKAGNLRWTK